MKNKRKLSEFANLDSELPKFDLPVPTIEIEKDEIPVEHDLDRDEEGAMVKADLFKLAKYSVKLFKKIEDEDQFESWVQAKITKAADYISSVYHYLEYEMKFSEYGEKLENSDVYSESQKRELRKMLAEGRQKLALIKIKQADKLSESNVVAEGRTTVCGECGGTGHIEVQIPEETKEKVRAYNRKAKAYHAASKRLDKNHNGIPDELETDQEVTPDPKPKAPAKKKDTADSKSEKPAPKKSTPKTDSESDSKSKDSDSKETKSSSESKPKKSSVNSQDTGNPYASREESKTESFYEGKKKPSAGLSAKKKSDTVKKAKAGGDIGKPGKNFDKVAASAGGGEKGKKIAAAAMWKNIKESAAYLEEKKASQDYDKDGKIEDETDEHKGAVDNAIKKSKEKECVKESIELQRLKEITSRVIL